MQRINKAVEPLGESLPDWEITTRLSRVMGHPLSYERAEDVFDDIRRDIIDFAGLSYEKLGCKGLTLTASKE